MNNKSDLRKKKAIDRVYEAYAAGGTFNMAQAKVLEGIIHDLFSWSPETIQEINNTPELGYLKDE